MGESIDDEEAFYLEYDWFIGHVKSLAMNPEDCSNDQGNFNVAHELWYFLTRAEQMIQDPIKVLTKEQRFAVVELVRIVEAVPESARGWTTVAQMSIENMRHEAWNNARSQAKKVLQVLSPIAALRDKFFAGN